VLDAAFLTYRDRRPFLPRSGVHVSYLENPGSHLVNVIQLPAKLMS